MQRKPTKVFSISNFNPIALFSLLLLLIGLILGVVGVGLDQWARYETERRFPDDDREGLTDGSTNKVQGLFKRCISYELSDDFLAMGLSSEVLPDDDCISMGDLDCSRARRPLLSALDVPGHDEIQNADKSDSCDEMKTRLEVSSAFMILGIIATFVAIVLSIPLWHWSVYIAGAAGAIASVVFFAISLGVFADLDQDFAGFFSREGIPQEGCLSYSFGIALAAFIVNIIASVVGVVAVFNPQIKAIQRSKYE